TGEIVSLLRPLTVFRVLVSQLLDVLTRARVLLVVGLLGVVVTKICNVLGRLLGRLLISKITNVFDGVLLLDVLFGIFMRHCCFLSSPVGAHWYGPRSRPASRFGNSQYGSQSAPGGRRTRYGAASDAQDGTHD